MQFWTSSLWMVVRLSEESSDPPHIKSFFMDNRIAVFSADTTQVLQDEVNRWFNVKQHEFIELIINHPVFNLATGKIHYSATIHYLKQKDE